VTFSPYQELGRPRTGFFSGLPSAGPGSVLVVDRVGHPLRTLHTHSDRLTAGEVRFGGIRTLYRVDLGEHRLVFEDTFPCLDDAAGFRAEVTLRCRVADPEGVIRRRITDVGEVLVPAVAETIRQTCLRFEAERFADAQGAALAAVRGVEAETRHDEAFLITQVSLSLVPHEAAANFISQIKEDRRDGERQKSQAQLRREQEEQEAALARRRAELSAEQDRTLAELEKDRRRLQEERRRTQAAMEEMEREAQRLRAEHEAAMQIVKTRNAIEIETLRLNAYMAMLQAGDFGALAAGLVHNPALIEVFVDRIAEQKAAATRQQIDALRLMVESGAVEGWEISEKAKAVLNRLLSSWDDRPDPQRGTGRQIILPSDAITDDPVAVDDGPTGGESPAEPESAGPEDVEPDPGRP
jgi:hypothetical protein